jgi:hypothetical protein
VVAVVTLALGIGANTAIFSVVNGVLLAPLPYREPGRLVTVNHFYPTLNNLRAPVSVPGFRDYSARKDLLVSAAVEDDKAMNLTGSGEPERVNVSTVSGDYFGVLGAAAAIGRTLQPDEAQAGHDHVAVLTWGFWQRRFGADRGVLGRKLTLDNQDYTIVGVMPAAFKDFFSSRTDLFAPLVFRLEDFADNRRTNEYLPFIGRLAPGVTIDRAQTELHALAVRLRTTYKQNYSPDWDLKVTGLAEEASRNVRLGLLILLGAVGLSC